jgi:hypothetical protein
MFIFIFVLYGIALPAFSIILRDTLKQTTLLLKHGKYESTILIIISLLAKEKIFFSS